jgi:hypothetical protein
MADSGVRCSREEKAGLAFIGECALAKGSRSRCTGSWHGCKGGGDVQWAVANGGRRCACAGAARGSTGLGPARVTPALRQYSQCGPQSGGHWPASPSVYG